MANEINGVSAKQEIIVVPQNGTQEAESAKPQEAIVKVPVNNRGMGTQVQSNTNFNLYGSNFENFEKFKGNDKHDAMRMTQTAANDIKKAYMQLQHEFPEAVIAFEPMPDPKACGKKREGFFTYQQMLNDWKDNAMMKINQVRTESTQYVVYNAAGAVMAHDDENADRNAGITVAYGEANLDKTLEQGEKTREVVQNEAAKTRKAVHNEGVSTRRTVRNEGAKTRAVVHQEGQKTRDVVHAEGAMTRNTVRAEGALTRNVVHVESSETRNVMREEHVKTRSNAKEAAQQTQELSGISEKITVNMSNSDWIHEQDVMDGVNNMRNKILQSDMPFEAKKEALTHLAAFSTQKVINKDELKTEQDRISEKIDSNPKPLPEEPIFETPYGPDVPFFEPVEQPSTKDGTIIKKELKEEEFKKQ